MWGRTPKPCRSSGVEQSDAEIPDPAGPKLQANVARSLQEAWPASDHQARQKMVVERYVSRFSDFACESTSRPAVAYSDIGGLTMHD